MVNPHAIIGSHDVLMITLDTLRYDVAQRLYLAGRTPNLANVLPLTGWERRHTPGSFTYAAHAAFFAGFLPTPVTPGRHARLFAARFPGSETTTPETFVFDAPDLVAGFRHVGYRTICIGGVGFFNQQTPLGNHFPSLFDRSIWSPELGVTNPDSTQRQVEAALEEVRNVPLNQRVFLFVNVSAIHQPNRFYLPHATTDTIESHAVALEYVDSCLPNLFDGLRQRASVFGMIFSDHGTAYGEDGYTGHRLAHPTVWDVPYAEFVLSQAGETG